jgi:hypothetical protein
MPITFRTTRSGKSIFEGIGKAFKNSAKEAGQLNELWDSYREIYITAMEEQFDSLGTFLNGDEWEELSYMTEMMESEWGYEDNASTPGVMAGFMKEALTGGQGFLFKPNSTKLEIGIKPNYSVKHISNSSGGTRTDYPYLYAQYFDKGTERSGGWQPARPLFPSAEWGGRLSDTFNKIAEDWVMATVGRSDIPGTPYQVGTLLYESGEIHRIKMYEFTTSTGRAAKRFHEERGRFARQSGFQVIIPFKFGRKI